MALDALTLALVQSREASQTLEMITFLQLFTITFLPTPFPLQLQHIIIIFFLVNGCESSQRDFTNGAFSYLHTMLISHKSNVLLYQERTEKVLLANIVETSSFSLAVKNLMFMRHSVAYY